MADNNAASSSSASGLGAAAPIPTFDISQPYHFPKEWEWNEFTHLPLVPVKDRRLELVNLADIRLSYYKPQGFYLFVKGTSFVRFAHHLQDKNPERVLDRPQTEACWVKVLTPLYTSWDPRTEVMKGLGKELETKAPFQLKIKMLDEALEQMKCQKAEEYWAKKAAKHPGLELKSAWDPLSKEDELIYTMWETSLEKHPREELTTLEKMLLGELPIDHEERAREEMENNDEMEIG